MRQVFLHAVINSDMFVVTTNRVSAPCLHTVNERHNCLPRNVHTKANCTHVNFLFSQISKFSFRQKNDHVGITMKTAVVRAERQGCQPFATSY